METLAYLHVAQEYEDPQEKELVVLDHLASLSSLKLSSRTTFALLGLVGGLWVVNHADSAQAIPLFPGDSGPDVIYLQNLLRQEGYFSGSSTGFYGSVTESAVLRAQADYGLVQDGIAGDATFAALEGGFVPITPGGALGFGDSGPAVVDLQDALRSAGYFFGSSTGYFGGVTESAVIAFQRDNGLVADGIAGSATLSALGGFIPITPGTVGFGDSGAIVTDIQNVLSSLGYFFGPPTGFFGSVTEAAVIQFQIDNGLAADGIVGPSTFAAMGL